MEALFEELVASYGLDRFVRWLELGAKKYDRFNWAKGMYVTRCLDSLGRHLRDVMLGKEDEDHIAATMCNVAFIIHYIREIEARRLDSKWDDRFDFNLRKQPPCSLATNVDMERSNG
jgi:hypothetical protein